MRIRALGARVPPPGGELNDPVLPAPVAVGPRWRGELSGRCPAERPRPPPARAGAARGARPARAAGGGGRERRAGRPAGAAADRAGIVAGGRGAGGARPSSLAGLEDGAAASRLDARAIELEVDGLRAYREGSPASRIHWPAVARTGELIERRLIAGADAAPLVVLDATSPAERRGARRRRARGRLALRPPRRRGRLRGAAPGRSPADRDRARPAHLAAGARAARPGRARRRRAPAISRTIRSGAVFWVTAAARPALPQALRAGGPGPRYLVAPAAAGGHRSGRRLHGRRL